LTAVSAILIAGLTASGKSGLALRLAERLGGALVNADSMQIYRDLAILTARPGAEDEESAPHLLFGQVDGAVNYSVGRFLEDAAGALETLRGEARLPIFVGGTGLYFKALTQGLSDIPHVPKALRAELRARAEHLTAAELHVELAGRDPAMAEKLRQSDRQRILRALEVHAATGQSLAAFQGAKRAPLLDARSCVAIFVAPERALLNARIDRRFDTMLAAGALKEVAALRARKLDLALPVMRALGVPHLLRHLEGEIDLDTAARLSTRDTRAYAKRQFTFARHQLPAFRWVAPEEAEGMVMQAIGSVRIVQSSGTIKRDGG
jgi:tRNA dimethylallyltransferase